MWIAGMLSHRPFCTRDNLFRAAEVVEGDLNQADWLDAFSHHPRIGEQQAVAAVSDTAAHWSSAEQSAATATSEDVQAALAEANIAYEMRFGFIFIICASGRTSEEILAELRARMHNELNEEIFNAALEQQRITRLRLEKLIKTSG